MRWDFFAPASSGGFRLGDNPGVEVVESITDVEKLRASSIGPTLAVLGRRTLFRQRRAGRPGTVGQCGGCYAANSQKGYIMSKDKPREGAPGTTDQRPRWEVRQKTGQRAICRPQVTQKTIGMRQEKISRTPTNAICRTPSRPNATLRPHGLDRPRASSFLRGGSRDLAGSGRVHRFGCRNCTWARTHDAHPVDDAAVECLGDRLAPR